MGKIIGIGIITLLISILIEKFILPEYLNKDKKNIDHKTVNLKDKKLIIRMMTILIINVYFAYKFTNIGMLIVYDMIFILLYYIAIIDLKVKLIDNKLFFILLFFGIVSLFIEHNVIVADALITGSITFIFIFIFSKLSKGAVGKGDAMVLGVVGLIFGYKSLIVMLLVSSILVAFVAAIMLIRNFSKNKKRELPFTPYVFMSLIILVFISNM